MTKEDLIDAFGAIDEKYLIEADHYRTALPFSKKTILSTRIIKRITCIMVLFICIHIAFFHIFWQESAIEDTTISQTETLPVITLNDKTAGGFGYQALEYLSPSDIVSGNPWNEALTVTSLPIFQNPISHDEQHKVSGYSLDDMKQELYDITNRLHISKDSFQVQIEHTPYDVQMMAETDDHTIIVNEYMDTRIFFRSEDALPEHLRSFSLNTYEENMEVAKYIQRAYADLIDMQDPQIAILGGDCNNDGKKNYTICFYDKGETIEDSILNYNFQNITFGIADGQLSSILIQHTDQSTIIGDYPIISVEKAEELLRNGNYLAFFPTQLIKDDITIAKSELIYRLDTTDTYFIPYYCFYVELNKEANSKGATVYGICYVPAIPSKYIETMPVNGSLPK